MSAHNGLVLHVQVGNGSLYNFFNNPATKASSHFWCAKDGTLEQYVDTDLTSWAQAAGNPNYLSVETEGYPNEPLTQLQILSTGDLLRWCAKTYSFPLVGPVAHGQRGFTQHCNLDGSPDPAWGNHSCPESIRMGQMPAILAVANPPVHISIEDEEQPMVVITKSDGKQYVVSTVRTESGHIVQIEQQLESIGGASNTTNTSIIDLTAAWPAQLS